MGNTQGNEANAAHTEDHQAQQNGGAQEQDNYAFNYTPSDLEYIESKEMDEAYGEIRIYRIKNSGQVHPEDPDRVTEDIQICTKTKIFDSKEDCGEYFNDLEDKKRLDHPNLVRLVKCQTVQNSNFCTNIFKIDMAFEYFKHSLETEILNRFKSQEYFDENSIFELLENVLSCLYYLGSQGVSHGDIQPRTILIDNYENFKITDIRFLTSGMCGYRKHLAGIETECFLAPELLQKLRRQTLLDNEEVDQEKADVFSLGLVALAMATLQGVDVIYNFDEYSLKEEEIQNLLENVKTNYSHNLYLLLASMLNHIDKRLDFESALNLIDQMRSDQFNQEDYERQRFQTELENSEKKLAQSQQIYGDQIQQEEDQIRDFEAPKRSNNAPQKQQDVAVVESNLTPEQQQLQEQRLQQQLLQEQQLQQQQQQQQQQLRNTTPSAAAAGGQQHNGNQVQSSDRLDKSHQGHHVPNLAQSTGSAQQNLNDIDSRVREALIRSQQVSMKFENSPLRLFRDQLLADELYVPLDPQFASNSSLTKSRNMDTSGRKIVPHHHNQALNSSALQAKQLQQQQQLQYSIKQSQSISQKKILASKRSDGQQKPLNSKWKI